MARRMKQRNDSADVDMTPMLDIVFILLIFFIVTATFLQEEGIQMLAPPQNEDQPDNPRNAPSVLVQIDEDNVIFVANRGQRRIVDLERLDANLQREIVENGGQSAVVIAPHPDSEHGVVARAYDAAKKAEAIGVIVRKPEG